MADERERCKVVLVHEDGTESLWTFCVGSDAVELDNTPFFTYGLSAGDLIRVVQMDGRLYATEVLAKSGNRTIRVYFPKEEGGIRGEKGRAVCAHLRNLKCWHEGFQPLLLAIDIPPETDIQSVIEKLDELNATWENGDPQPDRGPYRFDPLKH